MSVKIDKEEMTMAVLNRILQSFEFLIVALDALETDNHLVIFDFVKVRVIQGGRHFEVLDYEITRSYNNSSLVGGASKVKQLAIWN